MINHGMTFDLYRRIPRTLRLEDEVTVISVELGKDYLDGANK